jgi:fatty acid desaturase
VQPLNAVDDQVNPGGRPGQAQPGTPPGRGADGTSSSRGSEYAVLSRQVRDAGLLERRFSYYGWRIAITTALLAAGWAGFVRLGDSWWQLLVAVFLAIMFTQAAFLGHDAGHRQISPSARVNYIVGLLAGNLAVGLSYGWWIDKHNRHHSHPNTEDADPDINMKVLAFTPAQARASRGPVRLLFRYQAYLFMVMLLLEAASIHVASIRALASRASPRRWAECVLLAVHVIGYLTVVFLVLSPGRAIVFIVVQQALFGLYLGLSFAPNHKGMPIVAADDRVDFLRRQVLTSRNVRGGWLTDLALGGLNYQVEHHLFPSMPRPNLRRSQPMIEAFCEEREIAYCETSLFRSYGMALRHLNEVGKLARRGRVAPAGSVSGA